jgi:hypothetical protein
MRFVGFIGPTYTLSSVDVDCQRCINLYPELNEIGSGKDREIAYLVGAPGLNLLATFPNGPVRGSFTASNGKLFVVAKNKFYEVHSDFTYTELGTLATITGPVSIADNGYQLVVVDGPNGYVWDFTLLTFVQISDPAFYGSDVVIYQDSYFIFNKPGTFSFYISGSAPGVTFDGADISSKDAAPDPIVSMISDHRNIWLFGQQTTEVWFDSGAALFPFQRIEGSFIETGCAAAFSVQKMNGTVFWLGKDAKGTGIVYSAQGYQPVRISTQAVELEIQSYATISDAVAWTYQDDGHNFYVLSFPTAGKTWAFDTQTKMWHERGYFSDGVLGRHRGANHSFAFGKHIVGDWENGNLYELTRAALSDNGKEIFRRRRAPHISTDMFKQFFSGFQLDMENGVGLDGTGQGTDPQVILRWSDDGGHSWSNEHWTSAGKIGRTKARAQWNRLGSSRNRVFEVTITDPVKVALIGAEINYTVGTS